MSIVNDAAQRLAAALRTVEGVRPYDLGANIDPPALVLGMPRLTFDSYCPGQITGATFPVFLVVAMDERAQLRLWELAEPVAEAIESTVDTTIGSCEPGLYLAGQTELPSYTFTVEMSLS
ncbi:MAG TPA: hypothetical protein VFG15_30270 [Amycolatopsis sp.]|nr:hypothetical protein [Amycolatopsis sp.]